MFLESISWLKAVYDNALFSEPTITKEEHAEALIDFNSSIRNAAISFAVAAAIEGFTLDVLVDDGIKDYARRKKEAYHRSQELKVFKEYDFFDSTGW